ncbi:hypothetical protein [Nocardia wallacei]|uniref:hypothetical protein n=1 Tax=Nocardia wallacei TaxID=480035 RepID=UPI0024565961|nr:hypothetical protein [Nocardia wallacei]
MNAFTEWTHTAPDTPISVQHAHRLMQTHRACSVEDCPRKATAWTVLVEAGRITPDAGRVR